jgi:hypothetical protein
MTSRNNTRYRARHQQGKSQVPKGAKTKVRFSSHSVDVLTYRAIVDASGRAEVTKSRRRDIGIDAINRVNGTFRGLHPAHWQFRDFGRRIRVCVNLHPIRPSTEKRVITRARDVALARSRHSGEGIVDVAVCAEALVAVLHCGKGVTAVRALSCAPEWGVVLELVILGGGEHT